MNNLTLALLLTIILINTAIAGTAVQTDWTQGPYTWGPEPQWTSVFWEQTGIEWSVVDCISIYRGLLENTITSSSDGIISMDAADIDNDGDQDLFSASEYDHEITWWDNSDGTGATWIENSIDSSFNSPRSVYASDMDSDSDADIIAASSGSDEVAWWENVDGSGSTWVKHSITTSYLQPMSAIAVDVDGDGDTDAVATSMAGNSITWWENTDGSGTSWTEHTVQSGFGGISLWADDINSDGYVDIIASSPGASDVIVWWENENGSGTVWAPDTIAFSFNNGICVHSTDINGDNHVDVLAAGNSGMTGEFAWWENDGTGYVWTEHNLPMPSSFARSIRASDIDQDGDMDVVAGCDNINGVQWLENTDASGTSWTLHPVEETFAGACCVGSDDFNGDDVTDIYAVAKEMDTAVWWALDSYSGLGLLESTVLDTQESPIWETFMWDSSEPTGTSVCFQVRASDDSGSMGPWSDTLFTPGSLQGYITDGDRYFQYKAILLRGDQDTTPVLEEVTLNWNTGSSVDEQSIALGSSETLLIGAVPNPATDIAAIKFNLEEDSWVLLTVFDIAGRIVFENSDEYTSGFNQVSISDIPPGTYLVRLTNESKTLFTRFLIVR